MKTIKNMRVVTGASLILISIVLLKMQCPLGSSLTAQSQTQDDCEQLKKEITALQKDLADETALLALLQAAHEKVVQDYQRALAAMKKVVANPVTGEDQAPKCLNT